MKIVHLLLGKANPQSMNGVNKVVHHLATEHHRAGHDTEVWGLSATWQREPDHAHEYPMRLFPVTRVRFVLSRPLRDALTALPSDAWVQLHSVFIPEFRAVAATLHARGVAFGLTPHGGYSPNIFARRPLVKHTYFRLVDAGILRRASLLHAIGASEVEEFERLQPHRNVVLVPNGHTPSDHTVEPVASVRDPRPIVSYCGRLKIDHKGLDLLLAGFAQYLADGGRGSLWMIGDGVDRDALLASSERLGLGERVRFLGAHFGDAKMRYLHASDAFIHTSRWDVVPTAVLEAAAASLPVIVSKGTDMGDAVEASGAGFVLPVNEPAAIADALRAFETAWAQGRSADLGERARTMVASHFAWSRIAATLAAVYDDAQRANR